MTPRTSPPGARGPETMPWDGLTPSLPPQDMKAWGVGGCLMTSDRTGLLAMRGRSQLVWPRPLSSHPSGLRVSCPQSAGRSLNFLLALLGGVEGEGGGPSCFSSSHLEMRRALLPVPSSVWWGKGNSPEGHVWAELAQLGVSQPSFQIPACQSVYLSIVCLSIDLFSISLLSTIHPSVYLSSIYVSSVIHIYHLPITYYNLS